MPKREIKRLNREGKKGRKGHKLSKHAIYKISQQRRRSLY